MPKNSARNTLRWGVAITVAGTAALLVTGSLYDNFTLFADPFFNSREGRAIWDAIGIVTNVCRLIGLPLGCALLAAGIVAKSMQASAISLADDTDEEDIADRAGD